MPLLTLRAHSRRNHVERGYALALLVFLQFLVRHVGIACMSFVKNLGALFLFTLPVFAEHGGTEAFDKINKEQSALALSPVRNFTIDFGWAEDESKLLYRITEADGSKVVKAFNLSDGTETTVTEKIPAIQTPKEGKTSPRLGYENARSKDEQWEVLLREGKVILKDRKKNTELVLAKDDDKGNFSGTPYWSPDSKKCLFRKICG
jgi:hypothetical protein